MGRHHDVWKDSKLLERAEELALALSGHLKEQEQLEDKVQELQLRAQETLQNVKFSDSEVASRQGQAELSSLMSDLQALDQEVTNDAGENTTSMPAGDEHNVR